MPKYQWTCHKCGLSNTAQSDVCAHCGFRAFASGEDIRMARNAQGVRAGSKPAESGENWAAKPEKEPGFGIAFLSVGFGMFCLYGTFISISSGHWPAYMPLQLDIFAELGSIFSEQVSAVMGGIVAGFIGTICTLFGIVGCCRQLSR